MDYKKEIINSIQKTSGSYSPYNIFSDWIELSALFIQNSITVIHNQIWKDREQTYINVARKYSRDDMERFGQMFVWLADALTEDLTDVLGQIYMEAGMGSKYTGQFFTPFHLSELCARMSVDADNIPEEGDLHLNEPSCGGGGMVIAACKVLHEAGINWQRRLKVVAQDLDWKGVYMTYLQLSLIGCNALVIQGDTLMKPYDPKRTDPAHIMRTPMNMGALL